MLKKVYKKLLMQQWIKIIAVYTSACGQFDEFFTHLCHTIDQMSNSSRWIAQIEKLILHEP